MSSVGRERRLCCKTAQRNTMDRKFPVLIQLRQPLQTALRCGLQLATQPNQFRTDRPEAATPPPRPDTVAVAAAPPFDTRRLVHAPAPLAPEAGMQQRPDWEGSLALLRPAAQHHVRKPHAPEK